MEESRITTLLRRKAVENMLALSRTALYERTRRGLWPRPVKLVGQRVSAWPVHEVNALLKASYENRTEDEVRTLVRKLEEERAA